MSCATTATKTYSARPRSSADSSVTCTTTAVPDDDVDDTVAIQAAATTKCCLGSGTYDVYMAPMINGRRLYNMLTLDTGAELCGTGKDTIIKFHGDAGLGDWRGISVIGSNVSIHDLYLDTHDITNTAEQTHELQVSGPVDNLLVRDVWFDHPSHPGFKGGDAINFVGYPNGKMITKTRIDSNHFVSSSREGIEIHSGVDDMMITNNEFIDNRVMDIDTEGSGSISRLTIAHNTHLVGPSQYGGVAIALDIVTDSTIVDNQMNRGIYFYACDRCAIDHNNITVAPGLASTADIEVIKLSSELVITRNTILRPAGQTAGSVIRITPHASTPRDSRIVGNIITQQTASSLIYTEGLIGVLISRNTLKYEGPAPYLGGGIAMAGSAGTAGIRTTELVISHNSFSGPMKWAATVSGSYNGTGSLSFIGNSASPDVMGSLGCVGVASAGLVTGPIVYTGNLTMPAPACGIPSIINVGL